MPRYLDLTMPWGTDVQPLEGHPRITFSPITTHDFEGRSNTKVVFSIHTATHIDAPYHFYRDGRSIAEVPLEVLMGLAVVVDLTRFGASRHEITREELLSTGLTADAVQGRRVLLRTDWAQAHWNLPDLFTGNPYLSKGAAEWLRDSGISALGLDFAVDGAHPYPNHYVFLGRGIPLIENLVHLDHIDRNPFTLVALPLPVVGGDGGPARVVAILD